MGLLYCIKILTTLLMSALGVIPNAKADACQYQMQSSRPRSAQTWTYDVIDNIYIDYDGNQPLFIDDTENPLLYENAPGCNDSSFEAEEFAWDVNGNMTQDLTKGITSITYNMLNLPSVITYDDGHKEYRYYDTDGNRLRTLYQVAITPASSSASAYARYRTEQTRHYCGDVEYVNDSVARVLTPVGYVNARGNNAASLSDYRFYVRDYQGNNRVLTDYSGNAIERYDYYPYGGLFGEVNPEQWRLYGGKELQTMNGLNLYDFHARWQDYATCWFTTQDPLAEKYYALSPYTYCAGNPIMLIDPTGMKATLLGPKKDNAFSQLQEYVNKDLELFVDKLGNLTYEKTHNRILSVEATDIMRVIDDNNITINISTTSETKTSTGNLFIGGAFMGNEVIKNTNGDFVVNAYQEINPEILGTMDFISETPGKMVAHEFTEAYEGGLISQRTGISSPRAGIRGTVWNEAHLRATPQTQVYRFLYNQDGKIVNQTSNAVKAEWCILKHNKYNVIQTFP